MIATDADARKRMGLAEKPGRHGVDDGQVGVVVNEKQPSMSAIATDVIDTRERSPEKGLIGYPDGGLRAWGVVLGAFLTQFCGYGYLAAFGVFQDYYTRIYMTGYSASAISWIGGTNAFLMISTGLIVGRLYDKGYCLFLLYGGAFLSSLSLFMLSFVKPNQFYAAFLCQGLGAGLGGGIIYVPSLAIVSHYFDKKQALATSIITAGASLGSAVNPIMINNLLAKPTLGFATVTRINAGVTTCILIVACMLMKPRLPPPEKHANLKECLKKFSKDWAYVILTIGFGLFSWGFFFPLFYLQLAATSHGLDKTFAFYSLVILSGCGFVGRISCGLMTRVTRVDYLAVASAVGCGSIIFTFIAIDSTVSIVLIGVFYGFFSGIYVAVMAPLISVLVDDGAELGIRLGISFACSGLGDLTGPPIIGALLTGEYQWWRPAVFSGVVVLLAGLCFGAVGVIVRRRVE